LFAARTHAASLSLAMLRFGRPVSLLQPLLPRGLPAATSLLAPPPTGLVAACRCTSVRLRAAKGSTRTPKWVKAVEKVPDSEWHIHLRGTVEVIGGPAKGGRGQVFMREPDKMRVLVKGCNIKTISELDRETDSASPVRRKVDKEQSIHYSDVALVDPVDGRPCRVKYAYLASGERVRVSQRTGAVIPRVRYEPDKDRPPTQWNEQTTLREDVLKQTYERPGWPVDPRAGVPNQAIRRGGAAQGDAAE